MIEKFNFYDIYGYLVPGLALLGVLWLPFGVVRHVWPPQDWGSAIMTLVLAYVLGHMIQVVATSTVPAWEGVRERLPSETVLDSGSTDLPKELREKIAAEVSSQFGLDVHIECANDKFDTDRNNAFLLARQVLIRAKAASYAEQFQGMYALALGLMAVLAVGVAYFSGWAFSVLRLSYSRLVAAVIITVSLLILVNSGLALLREKQSQIWERIYTVGLLAFLVAAGYLIGLRYQVDANKCGAFSILAVAALLGVLRCYGLYRLFALRFATTVWRDFLVQSAQDSSSQKLLDSGSKDPKSD